MTAAELIAELQKVPPDTQIRVYADHGQLCMMASTCGLQTVMKEDLDEYMCDTVDISQCEDNGIDPSELGQVFEIGAP